MACASIASIGSFDGRLRRIEKAKKPLLYKGTENLHVVHEPRFAHGGGLLMQARLPSTNDTLAFLRRAPGSGPGGARSEASNKGRALDSPV